MRQQSNQPDIPVDVTDGSTDVTGDPPDGPDHLAQVRSAVRDGNWQAALDRLHDAGDADSPAGLRLRGLASYGAGRLEAAVTAFERLHDTLLEDGDDLGAARAAATVAMYLMMDTGLMAPVRAWLARADRLLGNDTTRVHAQVAMVRTYERFLSGDREAVREWSQRAVEEGTTSGNDAAVALGTVAGARLAILDGDVDHGLAQLDEVATGLTADQLDPLTTGMVWCELICAVRGLALHDRAEQWTLAMEQWGRTAAIGGISGRCRVHRAEVMRQRGPCDEAEREAARACEELRPWMRREYGWPLTELGTIRLRRGDLSGAEEAFLAAHDRAWDPQPGLALLRLAQGDAATAARLVANALERPADLPFKERPPFGELRRAPLLAAQVEIAAAIGDADTARRATRHLERIAGAFPSPALAALGRVAAGRSALLDEDWSGAIATLQEAVATWVEVGSPHEAAVARMLLGRAHRRAGNDPGARMEFDAAAAVFERLGSNLWSQRLAALDETEGSAAAASGASSGTNDAPAAVFRSDGDVRTVTFDGDTVLLRDLKGMRYLERLLTSPGREFHVLDLVAAEDAGLAVDVGRVDADAVTRGGDAGVLLDDEARRAYRRRLAEIDDDIEQATRMQDPERRARAAADREYLVGELARATGLGGRRRRSGSAAERARSSVTRTLRYALERIAEHHGGLGAHLDRTVRTGRYCSYQPDPAAPTDWDVGEP